MDYTSTRTQIYIPKSLRDDIDKARVHLGESLAEYLRKAALERLKKSNRQKVDLAKLADEIVGSVKNGAWSEIDVDKWLREERQDRPGL